MSKDCKKEDNTSRGPSGAMHQLDGADCDAECNACSEPFCTKCNNWMDERVCKDGCTCICHAELSQELGTARVLGGNTKKSLSNGAITGVPVDISPDDALALAGITEEIAAGPSHKKRVFICSPYAAADVDGIKANKRFAEYLCELAIKQGLAPYAPHLYLPSVLDDTVPGQRTTGIECGISFLAACDILWFASPNTFISDGMGIEMTEAKKLGIDIERIVVHRDVIAQIYYKPVTSIAELEREPQKAEAKTVEEILSMKRPSELTKDWFDWAEPYLATIDSLFPIFSRAFAVVYCREIDRYMPQPLRHKKIIAGLRLLADTAVQINQRAESLLQKEHEMCRPSKFYRMKEDKQ